MSFILSPLFKGPLSEHDYQQNYSPCADERDASPVFIEFQNTAET
jgi:hypothetical protein